MVKVATAGLDLSKFKGDVVGVKIVENEIGNVESGGIGIQIINGTTGKHNDGKEDEDDSQSQSKAEVLTSNKQFMAIMEKAVEQGFCTQEGWQYRWKVKVEAAYFASLANERFKLSKRKINGKKPAVSWIPFEALFGLKDLRTSFNDYKQCKTTLVREEEIDQLFE